MIPKEYVYARIIEEDAYYTSTIKDVPSQDERAVVTTI